MKLFFVCGLLMVFCASLHAQRSSRVCMTVRDWVGATIPRAKIKMVPKRASIFRKEYRFVTDDTGSIDVEIIDGLYDIEVKADGHKKLKLKSAHLPGDQRLCIEMQLKSAVPPHQIT